jgi:hypothetical protein
MNKTVSRGLCSDQGLPCPANAEIFGHTLRTPEQPQRDELHLGNTVNKTAVVADHLATHSA